MNIIDGKLVSNKIKEELYNEISCLKIKPSLVVIQIGNDIASSIYVRNKEKLAKELNIDFKHIKFDEDIKEEKVIKEINLLNKDKKINGIIVQLPIPSNLNADNIINSIDASKDVDGLTYENIGRLSSNENGMVSCTPLGILELFNYYNIDVKGKNVVIIGRSNLVGKPLFHLLLNNNATVTLCHSKTNNLKDITKKADIVIVAVGQKHFLTKDMVKKGSIVIDVGINRIDNKLYGDVDYDRVSKKTSYITPVPGGVGPMTVIMLMKNTLKAYYQNK